MRRRSLLPALLVLLVSGVSLLNAVAPAHAQELEEGYCEFDGEITFDNPLTDYPYTNEWPGEEAAGVVTEGEGIDGSKAMVGEVLGPTQNYAYTLITLPDSPEIIFHTFQWHVRYFAPTSSDSNQTYVRWLDESGGDLGTTDPLNNAADTTWGDPVGWVANDTTVPEGTVYALVILGVFNNPPDVVGYIDDISWDGRYACDDWKKPLTEVDLSMSVMDGIFDISDDPDPPPIISPNAFLSIAISDTPNDDVYSSVSGLVHYIYDPHDFSCAQAGLAEIFGSCVLSFNPEPGEIGVGNHIYRIDISNAYLVVVELLDGTFLQYLVQDAPQYVTVGQPIQAGCILGKTLTLLSYSLSIDIGILISTSSPDANRGVVLMELFEDVEQSQGDTLPLQDKLTIEVDPGKACNADPETAECMGSNPRFLNDGEGWDMRGVNDVIFYPGGGAFLNSGSELILNMLLDPEIEYTVTVGEIDLLESGTANGSLLVRIGTASDTFPITSTTTNVALEDVEPVGAFADGVYEVGIKNTGSLGMFIGYACITDGAPPVSPGGCYFENYSFDMDGAGWGGGGDIFYPGDGTAFMVDDTDATLTQAASLPAGDYTLSARWRPMYTVATNLVTAPAGDIDLLYTFDDGEQVLGSQVYSGTDPGFAVTTDTFTLADDTSGTFTFYININPGGSEELVAVAIDRFCMEREGGYPPGGGGGVPPVVQENCEVIANPATNDVPAWIAWQWSKFNQFFDCDLMVLLNNLYVQVVNGINTALRSARYFIIATQQGTDWLGRQFIPWLGGYLNNIALGRTTTIIQQDEQCHDIFCAIVGVIGSISDLLNTIFGGTLDVVNQIVAFLIDVLRVLLSFVITLVSRLFGFGQQAVTMGNELVEAWNLSGQPLGGEFEEGELSGVPLIPENPAPDAEAQSNIIDDIDALITDLACASGIRQKPVCITIWILENTLFGNGRQAVLWIVVALVLVEYFLWLLEALPNVIEKIRSGL